MDLAINILQEALKIDKATYLKAKDIFLESRVDVIKENNEQITILKSSITKTKNKYDTLKERLYVTEDPGIQREITQDMVILNNEVKQKEKDLKRIELQKSEYESQIDSDYPPYEIYENFFRNIATTLQTTDNTFLIDQLVKLVCENITVKDKKIVKFTLRQPFETYKTMKFLSGVDEHQWSEILYHPEAQERRLVLIVHNLDKIIIRKSNRFTVRLSSQTVQE